MYINAADVCVCVFARFNLCCVCHLPLWQFADALKRYTCLLYRLSLMSRKWLAVLFKNDYKDPKNFGSELGTRDGSSKTLTPRLRVCMCIAHIRCGVYLLAGLASVRLLSAVSPLVPLHVVLLDKSHVALVTTEWLLSWTSGEIKTQFRSTPNPPKNIQPVLHSTVLSQ